MTAPNGVSVIEDPLASTAAAATPAAPGPRLVERVDPATGKRLLEPAGLQAATPPPDPPGIREVVLRTPEEAMRAMLMPEPLVRYRSAVPATSRPDRTPPPRIDSRSGR